MWLWSQEPLVHDHDHVAKEKRPMSVRTHNTQSLPHVAMSEADGRGKLISLGSGGRALAGDLSIMGDIICPQTATVGS